MNRREFVVVTSGALAATAFRRIAWAQQPAAPPQTKFGMIRRDVGYFTGRGGTIGWIINKDAVGVVDTQYADTAKICLDGLKERSGNRGIDVVINTHHHADHTGGNGVFKDATRRIVAHSRVPDLLKQVAATQPNAPAPVLPTSTFDTAWGEKLGTETATARHYGPGHTGGDAVVWFERAHVVHMGDLLFYEVHPRVDRPAGASIQNWIKTLETVTKDAPRDALFIAGHARPGQVVVTRSDALTGFRNYFDAVLTYVRRGITEKKSKEEIAGITALPGFEAYQPLGTVLTLAGTLTAAYEELTA